MIRKTATKFTAVAIMLAALTSGATAQPAEKPPLPLEEESTFAPMTSSEPGPEIMSISVDGFLYSLDEFEQQFSNQSLHWVADPDAEAAGLLIAFTTEENRNIALGIHEQEEEAAAESDVRAVVKENYPVLYDLSWYRGDLIYVRGNNPNLGGFNDKATSIQTFGFAIILYEHDQYKGCSLYVQKLKQIPTLIGHRFCGSLFRTWNNKATSVKLIR